MRFEAALRMAQGGTVEGSGTIAQRPRAPLRRRSRSTDVPLAPLRPLLARYATLDLEVRPRLRVGTSPLPGARQGAVAERDRGDHHRTTYS